ncbi:TRAP-type C4-dicarboxylate transport system substrate-binding protein [Tepidamorphus gemmatus]|uniref:TRAP-type C4-dicarboxylate transport system substrate-binding protein n=1 Tax=Tepidamorphus gemmatus TaxID=747076 RepID=A0A4R3MCL5_9HYPH|nr:TRAP transporter substrate-binding protein [Tepidamorphus gemmatus]TCT09215.1 TRAP-type C4-dicarboxylate transport system substrate-binding protein [Tepidamorphus gemmatus]
MTRFAISGALAGAAALTVLSLGTAVAAQRWDMPLAYPATNYHSETAAEFARAVTEATGGEIEIVTHPGGSLFKGDEIFRAVRTGQAPIGERLVSAMSNEDPVFGVDALPFLATSFDEAWKLYQASKPIMEKVLEEKGTKLLYAVAWPPQGLYSVKPIARVEDMAGVKFRAYNAATERLAELMGAVPTKIEAAELGQAFATGVAESMISSGATGYDMKIWEYVKYWYDTQAWLPKNIVIVNLETWNGLDEKTRAIILEEAAKAEKAGWDRARELSDWYKAELTRNGMIVEPPSEQLKAGFAAIGETMTAEWLATAGQNGKAVIDAYRK